MGRGGSRGPAAVAQPAPYVVFFGLKGVGTTKSSANGAGPPRLPVARGPIFGVRPAFRSLSRARSAPMVRSEQGRTAHHEEQGDHLNGRISCGARRQLVGTAAVRAVRIRRLRRVRAEGQGGDEPGRNGDLAVHYRYDRAYQDAPAARPCWAERCGAGEPGPALSRRRDGRRLLRRQHDAREDVHDVARHRDVQARSAQVLLRPDRQEPVRAAASAACRLADALLLPPGPDRRRPSPTSPRRISSGRSTPRSRGSTTPASTSASRVRRRPRRGSYVSTRRPRTR